MYRRNDRERGTYIDQSPWPRGRTPATTARPFSEGISNTNKRARFRICCFRPQVAGIERSGAVDVSFTCYRRTTVISPRSFLCACVCVLVSQLAERMQNLWNPSQTKLCVARPNTTRLPQALLLNGRYIFAFQGVCVCVCERAGRTTSCTDCWMESCARGYLFRLLLRGQSHSDAGLWRLCWTLFLILDECGGVGVVVRRLSDTRRMAAAANYGNYCVNNSRIAVKSQCKLYEIVQDYYYLFAGEGIESIAYIDLAVPTCLTKCMRVHIVNTSRHKYIQPLPTTSASALLREFTRLS